MTGEGSNLAKGEQQQTCLANAGRAIESGLFRNGLHDNGPRKDLT